jgi:putative effector of murein hydrolase LrgA (UPF0299 family)
MNLQLPAAVIGRLLLVAALGSGPASVDARRSLPTPRAT